MKKIPTILLIIGILIVITTTVLLSTNNTITEEDTRITLCQKTGGTWNECGSGCGPLTKQQEEIYNNSSEPRICPAVCIPQCTCPQEKKYWDETKGCTA